MATRAFEGGDAGEPQSGHIVRIEIGRNGRPRKPPRRRTRRNRSKPLSQIEEAEKGGRRDPDGYRPLQRGRPFDDFEDPGNPAGISGDRPKSSSSTRRNLWSRLKVL
jgi:hypothetical protein